MSLCTCCNHFLMLHSHTVMVIPCAFLSCWRLLALDQIQLDAYCTMVWRRYEATFKLRPVISIFERNKMTEYPRKPWHSTSVGITWHIQPFSMQSAWNVLYWFFFCLCTSSRFSSQGTVNSMRRTFFFVLDHTTMSGHFSVWIMWTGNCRDVLRFTETFQSLAPFSIFILEFLISSQGIHLPCETDLRIPWLSQVAGLLPHIVLLITLWPPPTPYYVTMSTSEVIVDTFIRKAQIWISISP